MVFMISVALSLPWAKNGINTELMLNVKDEIWAILGFMEIATLGLHDAVERSLMPPEPHDQVLFFWVCMYVCMYVCVYVRVCVYVCIYECIYASGAA